MTPKDGIHQVSSELQLMMEGKQALMVHAMKEMMADFMRETADRSPAALGVALL